MILVRNRQQLLSGNRYLRFKLKPHRNIAKLVIVMITGLSKLSFNKNLCAYVVKNISTLSVLALTAVLASCSPKITKPVVKAPAKPVEQKVEPRFTQGNISVFIPFQLNNFNLKTVTKSQIGKADMPLDFYQGLMMGIDSAANEGLNFKVNVFDSRDNTSQLAALSKKEAVKLSNLLIGPVFPDGLKYMAAFSQTHKLPIISPLAASKPTEFDNPYLISVVPDIDMHGFKVADFIASTYKADQSIVVLINTKKSDDEALASPIRRRFAAKYPSYTVQEFSSTYVFETKMVKGKKYAVIVCSDDAPFVAPSLTKLYRLKNIAGYPIQVFGHPNWVKQTYNIEHLQSLQAAISSSYHIDYKDKDVVEFVKQYRLKYEFEPTEYAFRGFDTGYYFGKILAKYGPNYVDFLLKERYKGLHNDFEFDYNAEYGYFNRHLTVLQYKNTSLVKVD